MQHCAVLFFASQFLQTTNNNAKFRLTDAKLPASTRGDDRSSTRGGRI